MEELSFEAKTLHTPFEKDDAYRAIAMPVYQSVAYQFDSAEAMAEAFCGRTSDHAYSRITNPTVQHFENKVKTLTGAFSVTALNSGMAAVSNTLIALASAGSNIVTSPHLFGNSYSFIKNTLGAFGVEVRFCDLTKTEEVRKQIDKNTCALFLEVITNPQLEVADLKELSTVARQTGVPLIADTTVVPFQVFDAKKFGVDIEIISSTKYISGGATSLGGLVIDYATADWSRSAKLKETASQAGAAAFTVKMRKEIHRNLGAYMNPQAAYMQTLGLETLSLRFNRQAATCLELAGRLRSTSGIESVNYTGLPDNPYHEISTRQFGRLPGAMLTFDLHDQAACFRFMNRLQLILRATNLFDNRTLAIHPASTIYGTFTQEQRRSMDISEKTIRISVGLENTDDLYTDIRQAL